MFEARGPEDLLRRLMTWPWAAVADKVGLALPPYWLLDLLALL